MLESRAVLCLFQRASNHGPNPEHPQVLAEDNAPIDHAEVRDRLGVGPCGFVAGRRFDVRHDVAQDSGVGVGDLNDKLPSAVARVFLLKTRHPFADDGFDFPYVFMATSKASRVLVGTRAMPGLDGTTGACGYGTIQGS